jgi:CubicO group peptidase (beta-lactamase class C family)
MILLVLPFALFTGTHPLFHVFTPLLLLIHRDWFSHWVIKTDRQRMWLVPLYTDYTGPTGLLGTGNDLARFGEAFLNQGELDGHRILHTDKVKMMLDDGYGANTGPDKDRMGLGWHWWNDAPIPFKGHGGDGPGFGAQLALFPAQDMVVVVLANDTLIDRIGLTNLIAATFGSARKLPLANVHHPDELAVLQDVSQYSHRRRISH